MTANYKVISIGALPAHPLWNEKGDVRTGHATTTLLQADDANILVDPGLPPSVFLARMSERTNVRKEDITHVFLTSITADHMRALPAFENAAWYAFETERTDALHACEAQLDEARDGGDRELIEMLDWRTQQIERIKPAPDKLAPGVDLFPVPGVTAGACGLLLPLPRFTVLIAGDAVPTIEHLERGQVLASAANPEEAQASFQEAVEIADFFILGRDNVVANPVRRLG